MQSMSMLTQDVFQYSRSRRLQSIVPNQQFSRAYTVRSVQTRRRLTRNST